MQTPEARQVAVLATALTAALVLAACEFNQTQTVSGPDVVATAAPGTPSPRAGVPPPGCPPVNGVNVSLNSTARTSFQLGATERLDATPTSNGRGVGAVCHEPSAVWALDNADCELLGDTQGFNPSIVCFVSGSVAVTATLPVAGVTRTTRFTITPAVASTSWGWMGWSSSSR